MYNNELAKIVIVHIGGFYRFTIQTSNSFNNDIENNMSRSMTTETKWHVRPVKTDQSLRCPHEEVLDPWLSIECWSESSLGAQIVLLVLSCTDSYSIETNI